MAFSLQIAVQQTPKSPTPSRMPIEPEVKFTYYVTCWFITSGWKLGPGEATKTTQTTHTTINQDLGRDLRVQCDVLILYISYLYMYIYIYDLVLLIVVILPSNHCVGSVDYFK